MPFPSGLVLLLSWERKFSRADSGSTDYPVILPLIVTFHSLGEVLGRADIITSVFETFDDINMIAHNKKACLMNGQAAVFMAGVTRLELATSGLTGYLSHFRIHNNINYLELYQNLTALIFV